MHVGGDGRKIRVVWRFEFSIFFLGKNYGSRRFMILNTSDDCRERINYLVKMRLCGNVTKHY